VTQRCIQYVTKNELTFVEVLQRCTMTSNNGSFLSHQTQSYRNLFSQTMINNNTLHWVLAATVYWDYT